MLATIGGNTEDIVPQFLELIHHYPLHLLMREALLTFYIFAAVLIWLIV